MNGGDLRKRLASIAGTRLDTEKWEVSRPRIHLRKFLDPFNLLIRHNNIIPRLLWSPNRGPLYPLPERSLLPFQPLAL